MPSFGFVGPSYASQSINAAAQMCMNWYPEQIEVPDKERVVLYPTPGITPFVTLSDTPVRGIIYTSARAFAVGGSIFSEIFANGTKTDYGPALANDGLTVSMAAGPNQILMASGGNAYVFDLTANTLTQIPLAILTNVNQVGFCDGFFLALLKNTHTFQASALEDATTWPAASVGTINFFVDNVLAMLVDHREVWLFGITKSIVYYDAGLSPFPFEPVPGAFVEQGIVAGNSPVRLDNSVFWLGGDERGAGIAWRAQGYTPSRVSNHAVEFAWQGYSRIDDAIGYSYQDQGHSFWVLYFPTANKTWVYDVATGMWHERGYWNVTNGIYTAHRSQNHIFAFGKHLVGDWSSGKIYRMAINLYTDSENPIRRVRRSPHICDEQKWELHTQIQVDIETGLGPQPPLTGPSTSQPSVTIADPSGALWILTITDAGLVSIAAGGFDSASTVILNDIVTTQSWQIGVTIAGLVTTTQVTYNASYPYSFPLSTSGTTLQTALHVSTGLLNTDIPLVAARDPMLNIRWSDDGAHTWSNEYAMEVGQAGQFRKRAIRRRNGRARDRVYEINCSDAIPYRIVGAYLELAPGNGA